MNCQSNRLSDIGNAMSAEEMLAPRIVELAYQVVNTIGKPQVWAPVVGSAVRWPAPRLTIKQGLVPKQLAHLGHYRFDYQLVRDGTCRLKELVHDRAEPAEKHLTSLGHFNNGVIEMVVAAAAAPSSISG